MASINQNGVDAACGDLPVNMATFGAAATVVTASPQYVPPGFGAASSVTLVRGIWVVNKQCVIDTIYWRFIGDAGNVAGQLLLPSIARLPVGGGALATLLTASAGTATTAGAQSGSYTSTTPAELRRGDFLIAFVTPSATLTAVCTELQIGVG